MSTLPRGVCPVCGQERQLTKAGVMRYHRGRRTDRWYRAADCDGVGQPPKSVAADPITAANYALCDSCDGKVFYVGDADIPLGTVVTHVECQLRELAKVRSDTWREAIEALRLRAIDIAAYDDAYMHAADFLESLAPKETP